MIRQRYTQSDSTSQQRPSSPKSSSSKLMDSKYPKKSRRISFCYLILSLFGVFLLIAYVVVPIVFKLSPTVRRHLLFMNYVNFQMNMNLSNPESEYKLKCTKLSRVDSSDGVSLGVWHVLPGSLVDKYCPTGFGSDLRDVDETRLFDDERPIVLYSHGNGGTRGGNHRLGLYRLLAYGQLDAHVITFDYRGYGDSSLVNPSVPGLIDDAYYMYKWLSSKVNHTRINVWGHSLGTAVTAALTKRIDSDSSKPNTLTLEAPFNSIVDAIREYPLAIIYKYYPLFDFFFIQPFHKPEYQLFDSQSNIRSVQIPILILHAKDDVIVPYKLGYQLYQSALKSATDNPDRIKPVMVTYKENHGFGHKNIYKDTSLTGIISKFFSRQVIEQTVI